MDPLSIALAVVTIATAIKDLIELAQNVKDSVSQIARNNEETLSLSDEMVETIHQIKMFCNDYYDILENSTHMKAALIKLTREMQTAYARIITMLPRSTGKKFGQMKAKVQAWIRRNKIQEEIRELRDRVSRCYLQFTTFTVMRIEGRLKETNGAQVIRSRRTSITHDQVQRRSVIHEQGTVQLRVSDQRMAVFVGAGSTAHPNSSSLSLTESLLSDMYLHYQVGRIDKLLIGLPTIQFSGVDNPSGRYAGIFKVNGSLGAWNQSATRNALVKRTLEIQDILRKGHTLLTVEEAAWELARLSSGLRSLYMAGDSATTGRWTVHLSRALVDMNAEVYTPYLIQALLDLSTSYVATKDLDNASVAISESHRLIQSLLKDYSRKREFIILRCRVLTALGRLASEKGDNARAVPLFEEAVGRYKKLLRPHFDITNSVCKPLNSSSSWKRQRKYLALRDYSHTLRRLSSTLTALNCPSDAVSSGKKAVVIIRLLMTKYPETSLQKPFATLLYQLSDSALREFVTLRLAHRYAKECATCYRKLYSQSPQAYEIRLYNALWRLATILQQLGRRNDTLLVRQEIADLARQVTRNQRLLAKSLAVLSKDLNLLRRYDEAITWWEESNKTYRSIYKSVSIQEALGHHNIALALKRSGRPQEAIPKAEEAVAQYRSLSFDNPHQYLPNLASGLCHLSDVLDDAGDYARAFDVGQESLKLYNTLISSRPDLFQKYMQSLWINMHIANHLCHPTKSIERGEDVIRQYRQLADQYPKKVTSKLAAAIKIYASLLDDLDMVLESIDWCKQSLELYESQIPTDANSFTAHINCFIDLSAYLWTQGYYDHALEPLGKAISICDEQRSNYPSLISTLIDIKRRRADILCDLGGYPEALEDIGAAIRLCRETTSYDVEELVNSLILSSRIYGLNGNPEGAIASAREAVQLSREQSLAESLGCSLHALAEGLGDNGSESEAQDAMDEMGSMDPSWRKAMEAVWGHSVRLFAKEEMSDDPDLLERKQHYENKTKKRPGYAPQFAKVLWTLGISYCAQGRHEEGEAVASELKQFMLRIHAYPQPAARAERILEYERNRPSWTATSTKLSLSCHHQDGSRRPSS